MTSLTNNHFRRQEEGRQQSHQATDECVHGLVTDETSTNRARESEDAQLRDLQATRIRVENIDGIGKTTLH